MGHDSVGIDTLPTLTVEKLQDDVGVELEHIYKRFSKLDERLEAVHKTLSFPQQEKVEEPSITVEMVQQKADELLQELQQYGFDKFYQKLVMWVEKPQTKTVFYSPEQMLKVYTIYKQWYDLTELLEDYKEKSLDGEQTK